MNPEQEQSRPEIDPSFAVKVGKAVLGIGAAYIGIKIGESLTGSHLPYYLELGVASAVGSNAQYVRKPS